MGEWLVDVTDVARKNGTNKLVIRAGQGAAVESAGISARAAVIISDMAVNADMETKTVDVTVELDAKAASETTLTATLTALSTKTDGFAMRISTTI
jgi:mRNA-degrading endonuclease toxin of MazEF toxin-antitoxin module